jgi:hypothetical protein
MSTVVIVSASAFDMIARNTIFANDNNAYHSISAMPQKKYGADASGNRVNAAADADPEGNTVPKN